MNPTRIGNVSSNASRVDRATQASPLRPERNRGSVLEVTLAPELSPGFEREFRGSMRMTATPREQAAEAMVSFAQQFADKAGDKKALSEAAERGRYVFFNKALCSACHAGPNFTDNGFHNVGIGMDKKEYDVGRFAVQKLGGNRGAFKTPTLRDIGRSAPYMHDGSLKTLEEVVEHYVGGGIDNPFLSEDIFPLKLTAEEKKDLVTFLKEGLKSGDYPMHEAPKLPE